MTKQLAEAAGSWRTRTAVALLLLVAAFGTLLGTQQEAKANLPTTTATVTQSPAGPANINPGTTVTYTLTVVLSAAMSNAADDLTMQLSAPGNLVGPVTACAGGALGLLGGNCHQDNNVLAGTYTMTITGTAPASGTLAAPTGGIVCYDVDDSVSCTGADTDFVNATNAGSVGVLTINGVTGPADVSNVVGQAETFTWSLPVGFTCGSDTNDDAVRNCAAGDVVLSANTAGATVTSGPTVSDSVLANSSNVTVTINGTTAGSVVVTLALRYEGNPASGADDVDTPDDAVTKTYTTLATAGGGTLRHWDIDQRAEELSGNTNGILANIIDDADDATGSLHRVCIEGSVLTHAADAGNITWSIVNAAGSSATVEPAGGTEVAGPTGEPCVAWRSGGTGGQTITATYTPTGEVIYYNGIQTTGGQPAIKQWNTIDSTKIVSVAGVVDPSDGGNINDNTGDLDNWVSIANSDGTCVRDNDASASDVNCSDLADVNGTTVAATGSLITAGANVGKVVATSKSYIEYAFGSHINYSGPIDGVKQTFTLGGTCGSATIEDPSLTGSSTALPDLLNPGDSRTILNSDKGVGFTISANNNGDDTTTTVNADCRPGDTTTITITSQEDVQLRSDLDTAPTETITIIWQVAPPTNKQPILAWAGQRVVLEHSWKQPGGICPYGQGGPSDAFEVLYSKQAQGPGGFQGTLIRLDGSADNSVTAQTNDNIITGVYGFGPRNGPSEDCISAVLYESQDPGEVDISSWATDNTGNSLGNFDPDSEQVDFLIYYMKLESVTIAAVDGARSAHNAGSFSPSNPWDASKDKASVDANVSKDVLARVRVKGWFTSANPSGREAGKDSNGGGLPAGRWVMPDDWAVLAGGALALTNRPNYDIMISPAGSFTCSTINSCSSSTLVPATAATVSQTNVQGPFSLLDGPGAADSLAPFNAAGVVSGTRQTWLPDRVVDLWDAPMPPALVSVGLSGSGYLKKFSPTGDSATVNGGAAKLGIYTTNPFYQVNIPAEPWITQYNADGSGYLWNSWSTATNGGPYDFWLDTAGVGSSVFSAGKKDACKVSPTATDAACLGASTDTKVGTGGYTSLKLYSDNHGEAMAYVNGDAGLTMDECITGPKDDIISVSGVYCPKGALVGKSTLTANADYPDKRKHYPLAAATPLTVNWTWGGIKSVTVVDGETPQFKYVVFHVKDRDGFCAIPTVQASAVQYTYQTPTSTPTVEVFPLYVRTSTSQLQVTTAITIVTISPSSTVVVALTLPYAGTAVPGALTGGLAGGTFPYQATTTNTGFPYVVATGTYSLHRVLGEGVDFLIDAGEGRILNAAFNGTINLLGQDTTGVSTFDTADPNNAGLVKTKVEDGECQAWVRISNSLLGIVNVLVTAKDPEGTVTFDKIIDLQNTTSYSLTFRWSLVTWPGADNANVSDALKGTGANDAGNDIFDQVTAVYGWDQAAQQWLAFFPSGVNVPGANDLTALKKGSAYWIAIKAPGPTTWTIATNVG